MEEVEYSDKIILALREKCRQIQAQKEAIGDEILIGNQRITAQRTELFEGKCSMILPENMQDMPELEREVQYRSSNRPVVIKTIPDRTATFTLDKYTAENEEVTVKLKKLCQDMKKVWKQNVFYDTGIVQAEKIQVGWLDYKAFCATGNFYAMTFLFDLEGIDYIGNFHCSFAKYDIWKPVILKLLTTIQSEGGKEEENESRAD